MKISKTGYKKNSPDKNEESLFIPSGNISMSGVPHPVLGIDNFGNQIFMVPGEEYRFPGTGVTEIPIRQRGGELTQKYGPYVKYREDWVKKLDKIVDYSSSNKPFYQIASDTARAKKLDPSLFIASTFEEGAAANLYPDKKGKVFYTGDEKYPVAGFEIFGLDRFGERFDEFVKKGYLKSEFKNKFKIFEAENEKGRKIRSADFMTVEDALTAKAAFMAAERDQLDKYIKEKGYTLSPQATQFFQLAAYNTGQTGAREMMKYLNENKLLENDLFLKQKPEKYQGVYDNVMRRIQGAAMLKGETKFFKKGGLTKAKAAKMLHEGIVNGKPISDKQRRYFAAVAYSKHGGNSAMLPFHNLSKKDYDMMYNQMYGVSPGYHMMPDGTIMSNEEMEYWGGGATKKMIYDYRKGGIIPMENMPCYECGGDTHKKKAKTGIYIKPENRGKFTEYCGGKVTQACIDRAKRSGNSTLKKRAIFAENARKWKHQDGGEYNLERDWRNQPAELAELSGIPNMEERMAGRPINTTPGMVPVEPPINYLPYLNSFNFIMTKIAEGKRNREFEDYNRQMIMLQNQPATYTPEGEFQYGDPRAYRSGGKTRRKYSNTGYYQMGGVIPQDISYMTPVFDMPTFDMPTPSAPTQQSKQLSTVGPAKYEPEMPEIPVPEINKQGRVQQGIFKGVQEDVASAAQEILNMFPLLKVTSTVRNWGDKDAHPKGRAIDISGDFKTLAEAWRYYKDVIVKKYMFNKALELSHGTGPHIHVGYYKQGGKINEKN